MRQIYNPYLPSFEYVPDGEPHVFGDRIYIYGSHDRAHGQMFCLNDYIAYSASVDDLMNWRYEGIIYRKDQDPRNYNQEAKFDEPKAMFGCKNPFGNGMNPKGVHAMWAPDVVCGPDGRYYLYYCMDTLHEIGVAVCDTPAGAYRFLGFVKHKDGSVLGQQEGDKIQFDPGIFVDDDGEIYLYSGNNPFLSRSKGMENGRQKESQVMTLENDMITLKTEPKHFMDQSQLARETDFAGHEFFEASSIRKINGKYYFVYSSLNSHELCYCISERPDGGYRYGGTIVSIGDVFLNGRDKARTTNVLGNTHGGIECVNGQWYVFYHRQTNATNFSRQACAEKIQINADGSIAQVEVTSCGLNPGPLQGKGVYPAYIACHLNRNGTSRFSHPMALMGKYPYFTQDVPDMEPTAENIASDKNEPVLYIHNLKRNALAGFKYFMFQDSTLKAIKLRGKCKGVIRVFLSETGDAIGAIPVEVKSKQWVEIPCSVALPDGKHGLFLKFEITGKVDMQAISLQ